MAGSKDRPGDSRKSPKKPSAAAAVTSLSLKAAESGTKHGQGEKRKGPTTATSIAQSHVDSADDDNDDNNDDEDDDDGEDEDDSGSYSSMSADDLPPIRAYGHTYHGSGRVLTPNDESERQRQAVQHELFKSCLDGAMTATKLPRDRPLRVLDVGTGSGAWALELGHRFPLAHVMGVDLCAALLPTSVPRNVVFEVEDVEQRWARPEGSLDFVHVRNLTGGGVKDWKGLAGQCFAALRAGGLIEFADIRTRFYGLGGDDDDDDEEDQREQEQEGGGNRGQEKKKQKGKEEEDRPGAACREFGDMFARVAQQVGVDLDPMAGIPEILSAVGFEKVVETTDLIPIRPWGNDEKKRVMGAYAQRYYELGFENYSMAMFASAGIPEADTRALLARVKAEMADPRLQGYGQMVFITARKPFEDSD